MNSYLIPANSKKSMLIFGLFTKFDLILFASGLAITILLLLILPIDESMTLAIIALTPAFVTGFLVMPVPNYHNIRTLIMSAIGFFFGMRKFKWKGWCFTHGEDEKKQIYE